MVESLWSKWSKSQVGLNWSGGATQASLTAPFYQWPFCNCCVPNGPMINCHVGTVSKTQKLQFPTLIFQMEEVSQQVHSSSQEIESSNQQISVLRREFQSLEIELQSQISLVGNDCSSSPAMQRTQELLECQDVSCDSHWSLVHLTWCGTPHMLGIRMN